MIDLNIPDIDFGFSGKGNGGLSDDIIIDEITKLVTPKTNKIFLGDCQCRYIVKRIKERFPFIYVINHRGDHASIFNDVKRSIADLEIWTTRNSYPKDVIEINQTIKLNHEDATIKSPFFHVDHIIDMATEGDVFSQNTWGESSKSIALKVIHKGYDIVVYNTESYKVFRSNSNNSNI